ncbi:MAG: hypothetical protein ABJD11_02625 [Gemmatimonadota bacterium]
MSTFTRTLSVATLAVLGILPRLAAQESGSEHFRWYIGPEAGLMIFETPTQTSGAIATFGGQVLIRSRRTALILSVDEGIKSNQTTSYSDSTAAGGTRAVIFNNLRKYSALVVAFPVRTNPEPYIGVGFGILHTVKEYPQGFFATPGEQSAASDLANSLGSYGFGSAAGGLQFHSGRFVLYGQYQVTTAPSAGKLITGATHTFTGGLRISLGSAREGVSGGGY